MTRPGLEPVGRQGGPVAMPWLVPLGPEQILFRNRDSFKHSQAGTVRGGVPSGRNMLMTSVWNPWS